MLLFAAYASAASALPARAEVRAMARVRIERAATASAKEWEQSRDPSKREIVIRDAGGELILVRVIEYE
ncbi:hypothetical protein GCM10022276_11960 [Sphingomonas limnosediminicola]|jgi:hypothetical protein|uniref:PepSY domain-containing protein n=1 Tax=Sphingomonas limnosediminicola TaxID=940133 RepID=A0ABP7L3R5_9SPHN